MLGHDHDPTIRMGCDNTGTIAFAHNQSITRRNKHVDVKYHYVRDATRRGIVSLVHCPIVETSTYDYIYATADWCCRNLECRSRAGQKAMAGGGVAERGRSEGDCP